MELYGNEIWNNATPNSQKAVLAVEKDRLDNIIRALDEAGVNYCYFILNNKVSIAVAKVAVSKSDLTDLLQSPHFADVTVKEPINNYTPKSSIIGNTPYRDIKDKSYQSLSTDLALKVAGELKNQGISFSGRVSGDKTTLTIDKADRAEFESIISDIVKTRQAFQRKIERLHQLEAEMSDFSDEQKLILQPLVELAYEKSSDFSDMFIPLMSYAKDYTLSQLHEFCSIFQEIYEPLSENEYIFADIHKLIELRERIEKENLFTEVTYLKGYSTEQKEAIRQLVERDISPTIYPLIDFDFSPSDILKIGDIFDGGGVVYEELEAHIAKVKGFDPSAIHYQISHGTYWAENAQLERYKFITDYYTAEHTSDGSVYKIPIEPSIGIWNRLADSGVISSEQDNSHIDLESNGKEYNVILTFDIEGGQTGSVNISDFLTKEEQRVVKDVVNEVIRLEQAKQLAHEMGMPFSSKYSEGIDDIDEEDPYVYDGTMSPEDKEKQHESSFDKSVRLLNEYCEKVFDTKANCSNLDHVDLAFTSDTDTGAAIEVYADLEAFRIVAEYGGKVVREELFADLDEMNIALEKLDFDELVSLSDEEKSLPPKEKTFAEQVDDVLSGKADRYSDLKVCDTPQILLDVGCRQLPMMYTKKHLREALKPKNSHTHAHGLDIEQIKMLPELLANPVMIYDSLTQSDSIIVVTSEIDKDNNPIIASIKPDGKGKYELQQIDSNFVTSVYGRENFEKHINRVISDDKLIYISKEKSQRLFSVLGLQSSKGLNGLDFDKIIHQSRNIVNPDIPEKTVEQTIKKDTGKIEHSKTAQPEQLSFDFSQPVVDERASVETPQETKAETFVDNSIVSATKNFHITDNDIGSGTTLERFRNNLAAIILLKELETDGRQANPEEQETLSRYVGWGGLAEFFKESNPHYQELRDLLTEDEYSSARATTLDSFYTSPVIIDSIYTVLQNSGFEGGNILEPSMGIGNFFGRMPQEMQEQSKLFGVEIDSLTGRIAKQLYPKVHIDIKGFEKTSFKNGSFDVAVGNIPFGDFSLQYDRQSLKIHDYFFMQALDKVKDGGIVAFVTSKGTLDKRDSSFRRQLAEKADLIGAVRLPNTAFKTAGTEVTADIIFLQKRQSPPEKMPDWVNIGTTPTGLSINEYFVQHPDMVLGEIVQGNKMFGRSNDTMCVPLPQSDLSMLLPEAVEKIKAVFNVSDKTAEPVENSMVPVPEGLRNYSYFEYKDNIYMLENNAVVSLKDSWKRSYTPKNIERAKDYLAVRDTVRELLAVQQETSPDVDIRIKALQKQLNEQYDSFYKKYGLMHSRTNTQLFRDDVSFPLMLSLEDKIDKDRLVRKSDIFFKRTIRVPQVVESVDTPIEALALSINELGRVDLGYMSKLTDMPIKAIISDLKDEIFPVPEFSTEDNIVYQTASEYLSGDIYAKLDAARQAADRNDIFNKNISALEAVIPKPLTAGDIDVECGAMWIPKEFYQQFMYELFKTPNENRADRPARFPWQQRKKRDIEIDYSPHTGKWNISNKSADSSVISRKTFGTKDRNAYAILESLLNLHTPTVMKTVPDPHNPDNVTKVIDLEATKLVKQKAEAIRREFKDWIFKDPERRKTLVDLYNREFNCVRPRQYDGSGLQFHGMNASVELRQHQKNAVAHAIYGGNTLFAHCVGAGKTFEMIATAMESKRLGLCSKSLFAVPNHLTEQIGADFMKLYPNAHILVATKKDFEKKNRSRLLARIATGDYDAVIIGHSQLGMIPISPERQAELYKKQISDITEGIRQLKEDNGESFQIKAMERTKKSLQKKLEKLDTTRKDNTVYFEELGIDKLFVDEAHEFKNLMCVTKLQNVAGISSSTSQKAMDLFMKCRYLDEKTGGKGIVFATGTPVSNSITELHTMLRYLEYDFLCQHHIQNFDNWISIFGKYSRDWELAPTGDKFRMKTRISSFTNLPELMTVFKQCADIITSKKLNIPVPECELHIVNAEPTELQKAMVQELSARADDVQKGIVQPYDDNMLKITGDGRKVGLDPRLVDPDLEDNPNTKLNLCVNNVFDIYKSTEAQKLTQIIFCDLGVPKPDKITDTKVDDENDERSAAEIDSLEESGVFCIYDDIKSKLTAMGIPPKEIAFIHDAKTEAQKSELFEKMRSGEVRVLIGSTAKMGTGTNIQDRLIALHDLDIPWRPSDLEQRKGRMVRQGNINDKVHLYRYVTTGTFDAYSYQILEVKDKMTNDIMSSDNIGRGEKPNIDQSALTFGEIKAQCTGDKRIKEKLMLESRVKELKLFQKEYIDTHYELEDKIAAYPAKRELLCSRIQKLERDVLKTKSVPIGEDGEPVFSIKIKGVEFSDRKAAAEAFKTAYEAALRDRDSAIEIGEMYGFKILVTYDRINECIRGIVKGESEYHTSFGIMPSANLNKIERLIFNTEKALADAKTKLAQEDMDIESATELLAKPFEFEQELKDKTERLSELTDELNEEAAKRLESGEKPPRTHYFGKDKILSSSKKEPPKQAQERSVEQENNKNKGAAI